jgi:hypothetical protein
LWSERLSRFPASRILLKQDCTKTVHINNCLLLPSNTHVIIDLLQVYATNGQDHWLLGLQFIFKAYKEPVITYVDKTADSTVTVAIATQGLQDKYCSADPARRAELQRSMEAAALKFAQVCRNAAGVCAGHAVAVSLDQVCLLSGSSARS